MGNKSSNLNSVFVSDSCKLSEKLLASFLNQNGYAVSRFKTGAEILESFREGDSPDLLLIGIVLPGMSGIELLARLNAAKIGVPSIVMGTSHYISEMTKSFQYGAAYLITKPLDLREVADKVRLSLECRLEKGHIGFA